MTMLIHFGGHWIMDSQTSIRRYPAAAWGCQDFEPRQRTAEVQLSTTRCWVSISLKFDHVETKMHIKTSVSEYLYELIYNII